MLDLKMKKYFDFKLIFLINQFMFIPRNDRNEIVYENNFEENIENIDGGGIISYNNTKVIGKF